MDDRSAADSERGGRDLHLNEHLCVDLLLGLLSPEEEEKVLSHLAGCPACEKQFQSWGAEAEHMEARRVLRVLPGGKMRLEARDPVVTDGERAGESSRGVLSNLWPDLLRLFRQPRLQLAGILVAAAVLVLLVWPPSVIPPEIPDLHMLRPYAFGLQQREIPGDPASEKLKAGLEAYQEKDFTDAVNLLRQAEPAELHAVHETIRKMYLGSALAWIGNYDEAVAILESVSFHRVPPEWGREAQWTLYVSLEASGRHTSADSLLEILADKPGDVGDRAREILNP